MTPAARFAALIELTDLLLLEWQREMPRPAELVLKVYTRDRRYIGGGDRRALQESLFALLRRFGALKGQCEVAGLPITGRSLALLFSGEEAAALCAGGKYAPEAMTSDELQAMHKAQDTKHRALPEWLHTQLQLQYGEEAEALIAALMQPAPLDLRVNTLKATCEQARQSLAAEGIKTIAIPDLPQGLEAPRHARITQSKAYLQGWVEIQDRGSQRVIHLLVAALQATQGTARNEGFGAEPHPLIIDYCAGGGGKSLALAAAFNNQAEILAWDSDAKRLAQLAPRADRAGASCIALYHGDLSKTQIKQSDIVLVDAPCSGTGTLRRHPDLPWRLTSNKIAEYQQLQREILQRAAQQVKPGGYLCYATCSLLENENYQCVRDFLTKNIHFKVVTRPGMWDKEAAKNALSLQFLPHIHGSDGFYMALLKCEY